MTPPVTGLHHLTAVASNPQQNVDFYAGMLGMRLVKRTVNFDDPGAYHLYYGDATGSPGSIVTFFYWPGLAHGSPGAGQANVLVLAVPPGALGFWDARLARHGVAAARRPRFSAEVLSFRDPDGLAIELCEAPGDLREPWPHPHIPATCAVRGIHTVELGVAESGPSMGLLAELGMRVAANDGNLTRLSAGDGQPGQLVDLRADPRAPRARPGTGTVHHLAWCTPDDATELAQQRLLLGLGLHVSPVIDRDYFHSIYFREPGGVLFEIATAGPGFAVDEPADQLGTHLCLPRQHAPRRAQIETLLPPLNSPREFP